MKGRAKQGAGGGLFFLFERAVHRQGERGGREEEDVFGRWGWDACGIVRFGCGVSIPCLVAGQHSKASEHCSPPMMTEKIMCSSA